MSQSFTFQNAPVELLDVPQLVLLTDTTQKVDTWLIDRFFPQRVSYTKKEVPVGETVTVAKLVGEGAVKRRIMDMGVTKGVSVFVRKVAPLGDPVEVTVRGYELTLRNGEAEHIVVE